MQFFYHKDAKNPHITLSSEETHYLFRVRRFQKGAILSVRNLEDNVLYIYQHVPSHTRSKQECFQLIEARSSDWQDSSKGLSLILAIIDTKDIYDVVPMLNGLNVASLILFYADFSQKNRIVNKQKISKILQYSCMQCGRTNLMNVDVCQDLQSVLMKYQNACFIDFIPIDGVPDISSIESLPNVELAKQAQQGIIIGPEGGFTQRERQILQTRVQYCLQTPHVLTAHLAGVYIASLCCSPCVSLV
ncbi:RsmE family RNA methyltransferase [Helicobacter aurati]|uniref:Ribosomal RNA small subunit methyltransferase E n=1 Tax=Helicobacter aurati TaxID=137778 RepID=A0A3D8J0I7_9HELI|nr:RsmE family RNA methyltransferase [Helicobacter aurati]RDU71049.1 RsmE family RNA methyltransferase [Helicobacter aurati]